MPYDIVHRSDENRFETVVEGHLGILDYRCEGAIVRMVRVRVPEPIEGKGVAAALTKAALDWAREKKLTVVPVCPYVAAFIRRNPEFISLVSKSPTA